MYVESKVDFNLPKSKILKLITEPGNLEKYHPFCKKNEIIKWPGNGSVDILEYHNGMRFKREFFNWSDNGYDLKIGGRRNMAIVNWVVKGDDYKSSLRVRINPNIKKEINVMISTFFLLINLINKSSIAFNSIFGIKCFKAIRLFPILEPNSIQLSILDALSRAFDKKCIFEAMRCFSSFLLKFQQSLSHH